MKNKDKSVKAVIAYLNREFEESDNSTTKPKKTTKPKTTHWEDAVADRLKIWAIKPTSYQIEAFYLCEDIDDSTFYAGIARHEKLAKAHRFALQWCGVNRENLALKNRENTNSTNSAMLYHYLDRWSKHKKDEQEREDIKAKGIKEALGNITIIDHMLEEK